MKLRNHSLVLIATVLLGTAAFIGGCATTGMDRSARTSTSIKDVDGEIRKLMVQIDATSASLDSLVSTGQPDLKKSFNSYSENVATLEKDGNQTIKRLDEMKTHSKEYFEEWEKQGDNFTNPEIRALSEERRSKLAEIYAQVPAANAGVKGSYLAYLTELKEIQKYLSNDLTQQGIEGVTPIAKKSVQKLAALKESLKPVLVALDEIKVELYQKK